MELGLKSYNIKIKNTKTNTGNTMLAMDRFLESPYFVDTKGSTIVVFDHELATQIMLYDGDLGLFLGAQGRLSY